MSNSRRLTSLWRRLPLALSLLFLAWALVASIKPNLLATREPTRPYLSARLSPPSWFGGKEGFLLGTDGLGRDLYSRITHSARLSVVVSVTSVAASVVLGVLVGLVAGYFKGRMDSVLMALVDIQMAFPFLLLAIAFIAVLGPGLQNTIAALTLASWPQYARLVRAEVLREKEREYIEATRSLGARALRIMFVAILPNIASSVVVAATFAITRMIIAEASLSYLGLSVPPPQASWGGIVADSRDYLTVAWWLALFPGLALTLTGISVNVVGDHLRDRLDPRFHGNNS